MLTLEGRAKEFVFTGKQLALIVAATFMLENWPFKTPSARTAKALIPEESASAVHLRVFGEVRRHFENNGLWSNEPWTPALIQKRAATSLALGLEEAEVEVVSVALSAVLEEFRDNWDELCVASPGNLDWYDAEPGDLEGLADCLRK
jgi:hypothetical protein